MFASGHHRSVGSRQFDRLVSDFNLAAEDTRSDLRAKHKEPGNVSANSEQPENSTLEQGQTGREKAAAELKEIWAIRIRLQINEKH
jgi:hypothetical protein